MWREGTPTFMSLIADPSFLQRIRRMGRIVFFCDYRSPCRNHHRTGHEYFTSHSYKPTRDIAAGFVLAVFMANSGGAWDNAKKYIEEGHLGGKGSEAHKTTVVGDTVDDPFKDTSGPSLNILIKLMSMVAIVMAGLTAFWSLL